MWRIGSSQWDSQWDIIARSIPRCAKPQGALLVLPLIARRTLEDQPGSAPTVYKLLTKRSLTLILIFCRAGIVSDVADLQPESGLCIFAH